MTKFTFSTCYYIKNYFWPNTYWICYHIRFKRLFDSGVWLCRAQAVWRFTKTDLGNFGPLTFSSSNLVPLFSRFGPILRTFRPLMSQCSPSSGHLDPLTILLSFFRDSKAMLASTTIFFEDMSCSLSVGNQVITKINKMLCWCLIVSQTGLTFFANWPGD